MNIEKLPLRDRWRRLDGNQPAHPEYTASVIHHIASTPITVYLRKFKAELDQLGTILELTEGELGEMAYQDVAARIHELYCDDETRDRAVQALGLLAAPLEDEYQQYMPIEEE